MFFQEFSFVSVGGGCDFQFLACVVASSLLPVRFGWGTGCTVVDGVEFPGDFGGLGLASGGGRYDNGGWFWLCKLGKWDDTGRNFIRGLRRLYFLWVYEVTLKLLLFSALESIPLFSGVDRGNYGGGGSAVTRRVRVSSIVLSDASNSNSS